MDGKRHSNLEDLRSKSQTMPTHFQMPDIFYKEVRNPHWKKDSADQIENCKRTHTYYPAQNSAPNGIKDLNLGLDTRKLIGEKVGNSLTVIGTGEDSEQNADSTDIKHN